MRKRRILPATWPRTSWPLSSCTRNMAFGSASTTSPSNSTFSSFAKIDTDVRGLPFADSYSTFALRQGPDRPRIRRNGRMRPCPVIRGDEPEALLVAEPLHDTGAIPALLWSYARGGAAGHCLPAYFCRRRRSRRRCPVPVPVARRRCRRRRRRAGRVGRRVVSAAPSSSPVGAVVRRAGRRRRRRRRASGVVAVGYVGWRRAVVAASRIAVARVVCRRTAGTDERLLRRRERRRRTCRAACFM